MVCTEYTYQDIVFACYASMYALNVTVKLLATLTKMVISLAFSEISPEAVLIQQNLPNSYKTDGKWGNFADS